MNDPLTQKVIGAAIEVHRHLGPGLLESAYQKCLEYELVNLGFSVIRELILPITYKELNISQAYRIDLLVENELVIETKTTEKLNEIHLAQILTYLKFGNYNRGLLINFREKLLVNGIRRVSL
ncbi:GxxExxY protein [Algoriphagus sp. D3-2-R+10]|uniref:GxxExxY protein n=1 Tax=Algoriphagus aurantiacus TaxID=3103948 RepID=UPI002B3D2DCF|nr:GxxExxY protein [Algoriphagus sp. D3-2-R+10]MEB2778425.1 GxxExxY protein [Algoriphagus sp. D3-2-R+10]